MIFNKDKDEREFINRLMKISPEEFVALTQLLAVKCSVVDPDTKKYTLRDAEEIIIEDVQQFRKLPHKARKAILKAMLQSKGVTDGPSTENSTN
jgi:hypothetical protein